jgi:hypothetical protein
MVEEQSSGITPKKLMDYILTQMTAEEALLKLLQGSLIQYEKLKFDSPHNSIHPIVVMTMAAMEMGWDFAIPKGNPEDEITGMVTGTPEYIDWVFKISKKEDGSGEQNTTNKA